MADSTKRKLSNTDVDIDTKRTKGTGGKADDKDFETTAAGHIKEEHDKQVEESKGEENIIHTELEQNSLLVTSDFKTDDKDDKMIEAAKGNSDQQDDEESEEEETNVGINITDGDDYEMTEEEQERYWKQVIESEGFDVEDFSHCFLFGLILPLPHNEFVSNKYSKHAKLAMQQYNNENNTSFELKEVKQVNTQGTGLYTTIYITFEATDLNAADAERATETFQSQLTDGPSDSGKLDKFELKVLLRVLVPQALLKFQLQLDISQ